MNGRERKIVERRKTGKERNVSKEGNKEMIRRLMKGEERVEKKKEIP